MNGSKVKNGIVPIMGRVTINGTVVQFSCKQSVPKTLWDIKGNRAKGKSKEARDINLALDNINEDFRSQFNSDWAGKLLIVVDEVLLNRREDSERLKNLSTTLSYKVEAKVKTVTKSAEPPCKAGR